MKHFWLAAFAIIGTTLVTIVWIFRAALPYMLIGLGGALGFWMVMEGVLWNIAR